MVIQNVYYPIDWNQITFKDLIEMNGGIPQFSGVKSLQDVVNNIDVAVKFNIGELNVTMTRESIKYTKDTRILIEKRIIACIQELMDLSIEGAKTDNYQEYFDWSNNKYRLKLNADTVCYITYLQ